MRSMDLPYVGEDEALSWCSRGFIMHASICLPATTQHDTPLHTVLYWQPTPMYISWECGGCRKKGEIKDLRHFDNIFKAFIPFSPLARLSPGLWGLRLSRGNLPGEDPPEPWTCLRPLLPNPRSSSYPACIYSPSMLCLRLQLYSFVFYCSLATCVSPCLYLTILSGIQGMGTGEGLWGGMVVFAIASTFSAVEQVSWQWLSGSLCLLQSSSAQFCNIF